jgi:hypothetical protein
MYQVQETFTHPLAIALGDKPKVTTKFFRWKILAHIYALFNTHVSILGINLCEVSRAKPRLTVIQGGKQ